MAYTAYVMPTHFPKHKTAYDYDIFLAGTYHYPLFAKDNFSAVIIYESNMLKNELIVEIMKKYQSTFRLLIKSEVNGSIEDRMIMKRGDCKIVSLTHEDETITTVSNKTNMRSKPSFVDNDQSKNENDIETVPDVRKSRLSIKEKTRKRRRGSESI